MRPPDRKEGIIVQQDMRYVYEIYRQKSFSKAAQALFITQPALSIAIGKLEASLGMPLFDRSTRPISLTPAGRIYLQTIEQTRALEQDLRHQLDDIRALRTGTITIGSSHFINACILPEVLTRFNRQFPQVKLNLLEGSSHAMARMLEQREIDLTFSCDEAVIQDFTSTPVFTDTILLAVPQDVPCPAHRAQYSMTAGMTAADILAGRHLAPDCPSVDLKDFAAEPFILLRSGNNLHDRAMHFFREAGIKPTVKMELSQMAIASRLAEAGFAATFLSDRLIAHEDSRLIFYRLTSPEAHRNFHALTHPQRYIPATVKAFIDCLLKSHTSQAANHTTVPPRHLNRLHRQQRAARTRAKPCTCSSFFTINLPSQHGFFCHRKLSRISIRSGFLVFGTLHRSDVPQSARELHLLYFQGRPHLQQP